MSKRREQFASIIEESAREAGSIGMTPSLLLQATLPHSDPGGVPVFKATNGNYSLRIRPDIDVNDEGEYVNSGVPYGSLARLLIAFISTRVKRTGQRTIHLGDTQAAFMRTLDITNAGGENGRIRYLQEQMRRLARAAITFEKRTRDGERIKQEGSNLMIAERYTFWHFENSDGTQGEFDEGVITLSTDFYREIVRSSVPVDFRALQALRKSPLAMDLYTWITYRQDQRWRACKTEPLIVPWKSLHQQFGSNYKHTKNFAVEARKQLKLIDRLWPELSYETPRGRLKLMICPPHVGHEDSPKQ